MKSIVNIKLPRHAGSVAIVRTALCLLAILSPLMGHPQNTNYSVPEFETPLDLTSWKQRRQELRDTVIRLLGNLPPRPQVPNVRTRSREKKTGYTLEVFEFDNGAGETVPGYFLIPDHGKKTYPAIFYCHWHGGNYDLGKQEIFTTHHTPEIPAEALVNAGYAVMAVDAYCFGERSGKGPGGREEKGGAEEMSTSKRELWFGRSLWAMMVRDDLMALDYLFS